MCIQPPHKDFTQCIGGEEVAGTLVDRERVDASVVRRNVFVDVGVGAVQSGFVFVDFDFSHQFAVFPYA